jgi:hypothetical protein
MFETNKKIELSCWICRRKNDELINALLAVKIPTDKLSAKFTGEIKEINTQITMISKESKKHNEFRIPICLVCRTLILETSKISNKSEERVNDSLLYG